MRVFVGDAFSERFHVWNRRDPGLNEAMIRGFEPLFGREILVIFATIRSRGHTDWPPIVQAETTDGLRTYIGTEARTDAAAPDTEIQF